MLKLTHLRTAESYDFPAGSDVMTIGRATSNHVAIDNPHVSALHGQIARRAAGYVFQDLGSTNGSAVDRDGRRTVIDGGSTTGFSLRAGDRILLGHEKEPVVIEVTVCETTGAGGTVAGATVVATHRMAPAGEAGDRIEAGGGTLVPFLALSERLGTVQDREEAHQAFSVCIRQVMPSATAVSHSEHPADADPSDEGCEISVLDRAGGKTIRLPIVAGTGILGWVTVESGASSIDAGDVDRLSLAATLLGARLRQLHLVAQLQSARARLAAKNRYLRERAESRSTQAMVGGGPAMQAMLEQIRKVALSDATVLITGPSGSGKELVAREIHRLSLRHAEIFAAVNCGALVETLLETELFGCRKGAFTGAVRDREGLFEVAHGGTLFLDEIGDMSPALQVKLLRALETGEVMPVGDNRPRRVDVRVITATHRDLQAQIAAGSFREDLFYRIHVFPVRVPPLGERREDIPDLARHFLKQFAEASGQAVREISEDALRMLATRDYPGNVRQLANEIQRAVLLAGDCERLQPEHLAGSDEGAVARAAGAAGRGTLKEQMGAVERVLIEEALARCGGNRTHAAKLLGITRQALLVKLNKFRIDR